MSLRTMAVGALILALPITVEVPASPDSAGAGAGDDAGETRITVIGGAGRYALVDRGCEGQVLRTHPVRFREAGGSIEHRFPNGLAVGVRGGVVHEKVASRILLTEYPTYPYPESVVVSQTDIPYLNPFVGIESRRLGLGAGWVWADEELRFGSSGGGAFDLRYDATRIPSFHVRIGPLEKTYFKLSVMEGVPLYTGGGFAEVGVGGRPHPLWDVYMGINGGPFDGGGLGVKLDYRVAPHWAISGRGRLGSSGGETQSGVGVGLTYASRPRTPPPQGAPWR